MYARVSTMTVKQESIEDAIAGSAETSALVAAQPGFVKQYIFADRQTGDAVAFTIYDTAENRAAATDTANAIFAQMAPMMAVQPSMAEYELISETDPR